MASRLVAEAWPDLATHAAVHGGAGWDVDVWRFGPVAVRFPRRPEGARCLEVELIALPAIADRVALAVPRPLRVAGPTEAYPARFYAHAWLPGTTVLRAGLDDDALARLAAPLGRFVAAVHATPPPLGIAADARGDSAAIAARGVARLGVVGDGALRDTLAAILARPPAVDVAPAVIHGDLHAGNVLDPLAVIDWGDCALGDPAIDLAFAWSALPPSARGAFLAAYGAVSPGTWARARINAIARQGLALLAWGADRGDHEVTTFAMASLRRCVAP